MKLDPQGGGWGFFGWNIIKELRDPPTEKDDTGVLMLGAPREGEGVAVEGGAEEGVTKEGGVEAGGVGIAGQEGGEETALQPLPTEDPSAKVEKTSAKVAAIQKWSDEVVVTEGELDA